MSKAKEVLSNEQRAAMIAKQDRAYARQFTNDLKTIINMKEGRRLLGRIILDQPFCGLLVGKYATSAEIHAIAGKRMLGEDLLGRLESVAPGDAKLMVDEWFQDRYEWRAAIERAPKTVQTGADGDDE